MTPQSRAVHTYSPHTGRTLSSVISLNIPDVLKKFVELKCKQYERSKSKPRPESGYVMFSFGVLPPVSERCGHYEDAGVVLVHDGQRRVIFTTKYKGTLASLAEPQVFTKYI